jgi:hypothetical protein
MDKDSEIAHEGTVRQKNGNSVTVLLSPRTNCAGCLEKKSCDISGKENKIVMASPGIENVYHNKVELISDIYFI